jgi:ABC-2 type transport system ATP-binding protein
MLGNYTVLIRVSNLSKKYGDSYALKDVSIDIKGGSIFGLLGSNGAGKTTLISSLVGLIGYDRGEIIIDGKDIKGNLSYIQSISSFIPQDLALYPTLTAKENLEFFGGVLGLKNSILRDRVDYVIELTKLNEVCNREARGYSGGMKRRLNIAIGLLNRPKIIYLDEPTVGIDPQSRNFILQAIKDMRDDNRVVVYTSHYMQEVEFLCDEIAIIEQGKIIKRGNLSSILSQDFKATIISEDEDIAVELHELSKEIDRLLNSGKKIKSIEYGHNLESYFLSLVKNMS